MQDTIKGPRGFLGHSFRTFWIFNCRSRNVRQIACMEMCLETLSISKSGTCHVIIYGCLVQSGLVRF